MRDHPDIEFAERTGYSPYDKPKAYYCDRCNDEIEGEIYEDDRYEYLCEYCILALHKKVW